MSITAFPAIEPSSRTWTPGSPPITTFNTLSGHEARILLGDKAVGTSLSLGFDNLLESELVKITDHYLKAKGSYESFSLPLAVHAGMTGYSRVTPANFVWRYASAPSVSWVSPGIGNVSVSLLAVPN